MVSKARVLVRVPNWIGDAVLATGFLAALRRKELGAEITILAHARVAPLFEHNPDVGAVISFEKQDSLLEVARKIRPCRFGQCYILPLSLSSAVIPWLAGIPKLIGYRAESRGVFLTGSLPYRKHEFRSRHLLLGYLNLLGGEAEAQDPIIHFSEKERSGSEQWLHERGIPPAQLIGFAPGATYGPAKRWPQENWVELGGRLASWGYGIVLFGSEDEAALCGQIATAIGAGAASAAGQLCLRASAALLSKCSVVAANDTGAMHLAAAAGARVVAVFGSTSPAWTGPWGRGHTVLYAREPCSPCFARECRYGHYRCLARIGVDEVAGAIDKCGQIQ